jgi:hypothetical protein
MSHITLTLFLYARLTFNLSLSLPSQDKRKDPTEAFASSLGGGSHNKNKPHVIPIEERIVSTTPLLEALGNARTLRCVRNALVLNHRLTAALLVISTPIFNHMLNHTFILLF